MVLPYTAAEEKLAAMTTDGFAINLTRGQKEQYVTQFGEEGTPEIIGTAK